MVDAAPRAKYTSNSTVLNYSNCGLCKMLRPTMLRYVSLKCCDRLAGAQANHSTQLECTEHCICFCSSFCSSAGQTSCLQLCSFLRKSTLFFIITPNYILRQQDTKQDKSSVKFCSGDRGYWQLRASVITTCCDFYLRVFSPQWVLGIFV